MPVARPSKGGAFVFCLWILNRSGRILTKLKKEAFLMNMSPTLRLAVFDCDGTLVDSQQAIVDAMHSAFVAHGCNHPRPEDVRSMVGLPLIEAIARLLPEHSRDHHQNVCEAYKDAFSQLRRAGRVREPLYEGALEAIAELEQAGWLLGVATGKSRRGLDATIGTHALEGRFATLQTSDSAPAGKPAPDMILQALSETGVAPRAAVMIGDTTYDMEMARNAGVWAIGVAWGYHDPVALQGAGAHRVITRFGDLVESLDAMMETV